MSHSDTASESSGRDSALDPSVSSASLFTQRHPASHPPSHPSRQGSLLPSRSPYAGTDLLQDQIYDTQRRDNLIAMDRKRRLTASATDSGRRRHVLSERPHQEVDSSDSNTQTHSAISVQPSAPEVVDLTNSSPMPTTPLSSRTRHESRTSSSSSRRYVLPQWQPDSEVNQCPICHKQFTWLFRRHHCRKCGRVVCSECSPHRITIPRQFIVNPPDLDSFSAADRADGSRPAQAIDLTGDDNDEDDDDDDGSDEQRRYRRPYLGGGEKVRLCNPCVPDPQPEPLPNFTSPDLIQEESRRGQPFPSPGAMGTYRPHTNILGQISRHQPVYMPSINQSTSVPNRSSGFGPRPSEFSRNPHPRSTAGFDDIFSGNLDPRSDSSQRLRTSSVAGSGYANNPLPPLPSTFGHGRYASVDSRPRLPSDSHRRSRGSSLYAQHMRDLGVTSTAQRLPRPRLAEEDICPICRRALPPKGVDGDETMREAHVMECIISRDPTARSGGEGSSSRPGTLHMIAFAATEKDCIGEDGTSTECSICMVEYDPGDELARLECFCKFHKECIVSWLNRKAECPVHKASSFHY